MMIEIIDIEISTEKSKLDIAGIHEFISTSYWAKGRSLELVQRSIDNSICFGAYHGNFQVGLARVVTDEVSFAYILDLFVVEEYRGKGAAARLMDAVLLHDQLKPATWMLATKDAHGFYEKYGFVTVKEINRYMRKSERKDR